MEMAMKNALLFIAATVVLSSCSMIGAWRSIPPPGGCDQCHTAAISTNWKVAYHPPQVADERGRQAFQTPEYNDAHRTDKGLPVETKQVTQQRCFDCHNSPTPAHQGRQGRFHH
jgi:hypothetical protein